MVKEQVLVFATVIAIVVAFWFYASSTSVPPSISSAGTQTFETQSSSPANGTATSTSASTSSYPAGGPAEVVAVTGPIPPYVPAGPEVSVTLENVGQVPIFSLNATLALEAAPSPPFSFVFAVNSSSPLLPGQTTQETKVLIDGGFNSNSEYPLTIAGSLANGAQFDYTVQVSISAPG